MAWQNGFTLHIFAPFGGPYRDENWVEQILGAIVRPLSQEFSNQIEWCWITRYWETQNSNPDVHYPAHAPFVDNGNCRYVAFRVSVASGVLQPLQDRAIELARDSGCSIDSRGWLPYDVVGDLGKDRFIRDNASAEEHTRRAHKIVTFVDATVKLMLDSIILDEDGKWMLEPNSDRENPNGSLFESVHHVFCNATGVPTSVLVYRDANAWGVRTHWMNPEFPPLKEMEFVVRF